MSSRALHLVLASCIAAAMTLPLTAVAEDPNIQPGMWKYDNTVSVQADFPFPDQNHSNEECVTIEDVERGDAFLDDVDECEVTEKEITRDHMTYAMVCNTGDGMTMTMNADMKFMGDRVSGTITGQMESPMGPMNMRIEMQGERIGDC